MNHSDFWRVEVTAITKASRQEHAYLAKLAVCMIREEWERRSVNKGPDYKEPVSHGKQFGFYLVNWEATGGF